MNNVCTQPCDVAVTYSRALSLYIPCSSVVAVPHVVGAVWGRPLRQGNPGSAPWPRGRYQGGEAESESNIRVHGRYAPGFTVQGRMHQGLGIR